MQHLEISCAVRPIEWPLGVKWLYKSISFFTSFSPKITFTEGQDCLFVLC